MADQELSAEISSKTGETIPGICEPLLNIHRKLDFEEEVEEVVRKPDDVSKNVISALLKRPLKMCTSSDCVTPGRENIILRRGVRALQIGSPHSPFPRVSEAFKRPNEDSCSPIKLKRTKTSLSSALRPSILHMGNGECTPPNRKTKNDLENVCNVQATKKLLPVLKDTPDPSPSRNFNRAFSESHLSIMKAVDDFGRNPDLIGDCSKSYTLPVVRGKHSDLKEISSETLAAVLRGEYTDKISGFEIVDCRYPFEYNGGHINQAVNIHTQAQLFERYLADKGPIAPGSPAKDGFILIFHCEFSSQRGPDMCRFLRDADRNVNMISYPAIYYPEMYILSGGYKEFFSTHEELCTPLKYISMSDPEFAEEMRFYRSQSKSSLVKKSSTSFAIPEFNRSKNTCYKKLEL